MTLLRWTLRFHKWVALVIGIQIVLWLAGGFVMSVIPIETVRSEHKIIKQSERALPDSLVSVSALKTDAPVISAETGWLLDTPVWRVVLMDGTAHMFSAVDGERLSPINEDTALKIAQRDVKIIEPPEAKLLDKAPSEYKGPLPVWAVQTHASDALTIYIAPNTGKVRGRRSNVWRFYDFFWKLHVMDYDDGEDFNHPLLYIAAGIALLFAFSGMILLVIRLRRNLIIWRTHR